MSPYRPISGRDFGGAYRSSDIVRHDAADRRRDHADKGVCINGKKHGPATHGIRCRRCFAVYRYGAAAVRERGLDALDLSDRSHLRGMAGYWAKRATQQEKAA